MINTLIHPDLLTLTLASLSLDAGGVGPVGTIPGPAWAGLIIWLPAIAAIACGVCAALKLRNKLPGYITCGLLGMSFILTLALYMGYDAGRPYAIHLFDWFNIQWGSGGRGESFIANFALYVDGLTLLWMLFVTGLGTLIAVYATEYMEADVRGAGYARFFAGVAIFLFAMSCLVMGDNLVLLYLGWEGVGFASYFLIGYYYQKPSAVEAAKKAFIMNRIGDLGLALGIWFIWHNFGTVRYEELFAIFHEAHQWIISQYGGFDATHLHEAFINLGYGATKGSWTIGAIPFLLMLGAFGKSAQIPLYVWLPDAMEGPTPVSALIHAATMVTAGVFLLCRMFPLMELHPAALPTVMWIGAMTALLAATIAMAQYDIKRIMAYSTVSQLGYMFAGVGVFTTFGAAYHVFTHAFFKAVLFLTCGAIMHGFAGQLDLRRISGLRRMPGWKITAWTMFIACLCLVGFPGTSGYFSKDVILAQTFSHHAPLVGVILLLTAGLTAYYTFRVWFRVCAGPMQHEMGDEHHGGDEHDDHAHGHDHHHHHHHEPHPPRLAINGVLVIITIGAILAAIPYFVPEYGNGWAQRMVADSSAMAGADAHGDGTIFGLNPHKAMYFVSALIGVIGIVIAWRLHLSNRRQADALRDRLLASRLTRWLPLAMENKWYVDEMYHRLIRAPLWFFGNLFWLFDRLVIDMLIVDVLFGRTPRKLGEMFRPLQSGLLHDYARSMVGALALVILFILLLASGALNFLMPGAAAGQGFSHRGVSHRGDAECAERRDDVEVRGEVLCMDESFRFLLIQESSDFTMMFGPPAQSVPHRALRAAVYPPWRVVKSESDSLEVIAR